MWAKVVMRAKSVRQEAEKKANGRLIVTPSKTMEAKRSLPQTLTLDHVSPATRLLEKRRFVALFPPTLRAHSRDLTPIAMCFLQANV